MSCLWQQVWKTPAAAKKMVCPYTEKAWTSNMRPGDPMLVYRCCSRNLQTEHSVTLQNSEKNPVVRIQRIGNSSPLVSNVYACGFDDDFFNHHWRPRQTFQFKAIWSRLDFQLRHNSTALFQRVVFWTPRPVALARKSGRTSHRYNIDKQLPWLVRHGN